MLSNPAKYHCEIESDETFKCIEISPESHFKPDMF